MERWPPAYDADDLAKLIRQLRDHQQDHSFYEHYDAMTLRCQGDVIKLGCDIPLIDKSGLPVTMGHEWSLWLVIGNTCDLDRKIEDLPWSQIVPILPLGTEDEVEARLLGDIQNYRPSRFFYLPDWLGRTPPNHYMAEFIKPVTVHKQAIFDSKLEARLSRSAWILLNACFVRFLARDDGRFVA